LLLGGIMVFGPADMRFCRLNTDNRAVPGFAALLGRIEKPFRAE